MAGEPLLLALSSINLTRHLFGFGVGGGGRGRAPLMAYTVGRALMPFFLLHHSAARFSL